MKVLIICNSSSGLYQFRINLIESLIEKGNIVEAIVPLTDDEIEIFAENDLITSDCRLHRVSIERRGINPVKDLKLIKSYSKIIKSVKPDIVITYTIKPNVYGGIVCKKHKIPFFANVTGIGTAFQEEGTLKKLVTFLNKASLKNAKVVFFENIENKNIFVKLGIVSEEQTYVLNGAGVDLEKYKFEEYPNENENIRFLFIGRIMKEKGIDELFAAAERIHKDYLNVHFDLLGYFEDNYESVISELSDRGIIEYYGYQSDVHPFIQRAHCFILPSWHEGMANTNLECAAMGRPLITSNIHGCKEAVIENESGFLCEPKNADSLYEKIKEFIELPYDKKVQMGIASRKHTEEVFDKKVVVANTIKRIKESLNQDRI